MMAQQSLFVLLSLACCSAVQGIEVDFSDSLHAGLKDSALSMPKLAGLLQQRLGHASHSGSPWKAQAETFLGLLQSMGGTVPESARPMVDTIITLLTNASGAIKTDAQDSKDRTQSQLNDAYGNLSETETAANQAKTVTEAIDADLKSCYDHLGQITANHSVHCGVKALPAACDRKNNTKMHTFDVAPKDTYSCNFTAGSDPTKCTSEASPLKTDLVSARDTLRLAYNTWKLENKTCNDDLEAERLLCHNTNNTYWAKKATCQETYLNASAHLCNFRVKIKSWKGYLTTLNSTQATAKTLLAPKKQEWTDLNLIICMMKKFRDRTKMTFEADDYANCDAESKGKTWIGEIDTLETSSQTLLSSTLYNKECMSFTFSGGFPQKLETGASVTFFTKPNAVFKYNTDGSDGCTSTSAAFTKFCEGGSYTTAVQ